MKNGKLKIQMMKYQLILLKRQLVYAHNAVMLLIDTLLVII